MTAYAVWFIIFACIAYLIATDENVAKAVYFTGKIVNNKFARFRWWVINNPRTPWAQYVMWKRSNQLAKELMNEIESKNK